MTRLLVEETEQAPFPKEAELKLRARVIVMSIVLYASLFAERALAAEIAGQWMGVIGGTDHIVLIVTRKDDSAYVARVANLEAGEPSSLPTAWTSVRSTS